MEAHDLPEPHHDLLLVPPDLSLNLLSRTICCICEVNDADLIAYPLVRCRGCGLIYANPRSRFLRASQPSGFFERIHRWLASKRLIRLCRALGENARILEVSDRGSLRSLTQHPASWRIDRIDPDFWDVPSEDYDLALMVGTMEQIEQPTEVLAAVRSRLKLGGRLVVIGKNADTVQAKRVSDWNLFNPNNVRLLAQKMDFQVESLTRSGAQFCAILKRAW